MSVSPALQDVSIAQSERDKTTSVNYWLEEQYIAVER